MPACGPLGGYFVVRFFPGAWGVYQWQCVELSMRYLYLRYGINPYQANGSQVVWNYSGTYLRKIGNGTVNSPPRVGNVLSYGATSTSGHTAVVTASSVNSSGNGTITIIQQNSTANGWGTLSVSNWRVSSGVSGWLHR
jgi:hypothetical protein